MAQLAILGHATRGSEVIALLEMLGGKNIYNSWGVFGNRIYTIDEKTDEIIDVSKNRYSDYNIFSLEEFEGKFPYKVGDKVKNARINDFIGRITNARWDCNEEQIIYVVEWDDVSKSTLTYFARGLQPYKEETMKDKINIAELLKDCPKGMELDCTAFDNVTFDYVNTEQNRIYCKIDNRDTVWFTAKGCINLAPSAKCVIFPKGKTTWEGFHRPFKDGDIIASLNTSIYIFTNCSSTVDEYFFAPCGLIADRNCDNHYFKVGTISISVDNMRLASEEEKQKLFKAIKDNGYRWNEETKTLEKLPKFKVGDRVKHISAYTSGIVVKVSDKGYHIDYPKGEGVCYISFTLEKDYELAPDKFDISTLKPFESKVLVRDSEDLAWRPAIFGLYKPQICEDFPFIVVGGVSYSYCIPYEGNEHLLGTTNDCDDFYKTWEK